MKTKTLLIGIGLALAIYLILPFNNFLHSVEGSGNVIKEKRELSSFHAIDIGSAFRIYLKKGEPQSITIESDDNIVPLIKTKVTNGELDVSIKGSITNTEKMNIYITVPRLDEIELSGAAKLTSEDRFDEDKMKIDLSGASRLELNIKTNKLKLEVSGASNVSLNGHAASLDLDASGASKTKISELEVNNASIDCSGAANIWLSVIESLKGEASGASSIYYKGNPKQVNIETSGAASVDRK